MVLKTLLVILLAGLSPAVAPPAAWAVPAVTCSDVSTPISVTGVPDGVIYGRYCRSAVSSGKPLQILVPGVTYTHSYGTFVSDLTAATYHDVDGVIGTGWFQQPSALGVVGLVATLWPAAVDPRFLGRILDPTYVTTRPGTRAFFYQQDNTDPAVIAADDASKDTASLSETTYLVEVNTGLSTRIGVPTLRVIGQYDRVICNPLPCTQSGLEQTAPVLFPAGAQVYVQSGAGHDIALELNNTSGFEASLAWLESHF